jgi:glycosyl transferase, family 25
MNPWDFFDAIYCINLEKEVKRREKASNIFNRFGIPVTFFKGIPDKISNKGCLASHKAIYNLALQKGYKKIFIFEDDIIPTKELTSDKVKYCTDFMERYHWDIFYFGAVSSTFNYHQIKSPVKNIYKIKGICAHAYALNNSALQKLKDIEWEPKNPLDYIIRDDDTLENYAIYPSLFYQETGYKLPINVITSGLRINEFYAYHINIPFKYVLIFLIILFIIILWWKYKSKTKINQKLK